MSDLDSFGQPLRSRTQDEAWARYHYMVETWRGDKVEFFLGGHRSIDDAREHYEDAVRILPPTERITLRKRSWVLQDSQRA